MMVLNERHQRDLNRRLSTPQASMDGAWARDVSNIQSLSAPGSAEYYTFADFRLYPRRRTLLCGGDIVPIGGRAFDLLLLLVSEAGHVVDPSDLMDAVWHNVTVEPANLRVQMGLVRRALARTDQGKRAIETVPLRGYCFVLPVIRHRVETRIDRPAHSAWSDRPRRSRYGQRSL